MDFLWHFFQSDTFLWALIGIPSFMGFLILMRLMRAGRKSFEERHAAMDARILQTTQDTEDLNKSIQKSEHLHIIATALQEAINWPAYNTNSPFLPYSAHKALTAPSPAPIVNAHIRELAQSVELHTPNMVYTIIFTEKKHYLHSTKKTVRGQGYFEVSETPTKATPSTLHNKDFEKDIQSNIPSKTKPSAPSLAQNMQSQNSIFNKGKITNTSFVKDAEQSKDNVQIFYDLCTLEHYLLQKLRNTREYKGPPALRKK